MKVITENNIRQLLRHKKLHRGEQLTLTEPSIITPSAQSYLREFQIEVKQINNGETSPRSFKKEIQAGTSNIRSGDLMNLDNEIAKLRELFYFPLLPDIFFDESLWHYWKLQQDLLEQFKQSRYTVVIKTSLPIKPQTFQFKSCPWRTWQYSTAELLRQMKYVEELIKLFPQVSESFTAWSKEIIAVINNER
ncbi:hypothetical protein [Veillonella intestinalis]|uniref:hypothetical protein n=1 Tax=Veillonella intestinalis TaxID=2941341 RepID=UPI00203B9DAF|nr:hypothetical protein [Veillonella intestinalis]